MAVPMAPSSTTIRSLSIAVSSSVASGRMVRVADRVGGEGGHGSHRLRDSSSTVSSLRSAVHTADGISTDWTQAADASTAPTLTNRRPRE